jgi:hypothetical protein
MNNFGVSAFEAAGIGRSVKAGDSIPFLFRYSASN